MLVPRAVDYASKKGEERRIGGIANGGEVDKRKCRYYSTVASSVIIVIIYMSER